MTGDDGYTWEEFFDPWEEEDYPPYGDQAAEIEAWEEEPGP